MDMQDLAADLPYEPQRWGLAAGQTVVGLIALAVVLVVDLVEGLRVLGVMTVVWVVIGVVFLAIDRFVRRRAPGSVVPGGIRLGEGPARRDRQVAFSTALKGSLLVNTVMAVVMGTAFWFLGSFAVLPGLLLGMAGMAAVEIRGLQRWEQANGLTLCTRVGTRGRRPTGLKETEKLVAVPRGRDADV